MSTARYMVKAFLTVASEEPSQARQKKVGAFLSNLTGAEARGFLALMRAGESMRSDFDELMRGISEDHQHKSGIIEEISTHSETLAEYMQTGLQLALDSNLDLDAYFRTRSQSQRRRMFQDVEQ